METSLAYQLEKLNDKIDSIETAPVKFSETFQTAPQFGEGFKELGIMAVGGAISPIVGNIINKFIPIGALGGLLGGFAIKTLVKNPTAGKLADGMIIASMSQFVGNLLGGKMGFSETAEDDPASFSEQRVGGINFG
jgi:hypothetical protein